MQAAIPAEDLRRPVYGDKMYTQKLANFCQERGGLAILLIHHARKADASDIIDSASGTTGLTGGVDNTGVLQAGEEPGTGILHLLGRDIERDDPVHLRWDARLAQWNASDGPSLKISPEREKVLTLLDERPGLTPKEIAIVLDRAEPGTRRLLGEMLRDGLLRSAQGAYSLSDTGESVLSA